MSDFLRQLRSGGGKRFDRNRRSYDSPQYRSTDRHTGRDRKSPAQRKNYDHNQIQAIRKILETIADGQRMIAEQNQRQVIAIERIADALVAISGKSGGIAKAETAVPAPPPPEVLSDTEPEVQARKDGADPTLSKGRETAMDIIRIKREEGESFDRIAEYLESERVPTISGRGRWRAQSVSRLFNQYIQQNR